MLTMLLKLSSLLTVGKNSICNVQTIEFLTHFNVNFLLLHFQFIFKNKFLATTIGNLFMRLNNVFVFN